MTYEEASIAIKTWCGAMRIANINDEFAMEFIKAAETAILPLIRQMPKKPNVGKRTIPQVGIDYFSICPVCGCEINNDLISKNYCTNCGQALDWS